jgi:hypothetical protein
MADNSHSKNLTIYSALLALSAVGCGLFIVGGQSALYGLAAMYYPTEMRGTRTADCNRWTDRMWENNVDQSVNAFL